MKTQINTIKLAHEFAAEIKRKNISFRLVYGQEWAGLQADDSSNKNLRDYALEFFNQNGLYLKNNEKEFNEFYLESAKLLGH